MEGMTENKTLREIELIRENAMSNKDIAEFRAKVFSKALREWKRNTGLSEGDFAKRIGAHQNSITKWKRFFNPRMDKFTLICTELQIDKKMFSLNSYAEHLENPREIKMLREISILEAKLRRYEQLLKIIGGECKQFLTDIEPRQTEPTEPLTAHWIICSDGYYPYCSYCHGEPTSGIRTKYCPDCGRRMEDYKCYL